MPADEVPDALAGLVAHGSLDAELAGLLWVLREAGLPLLVAGPPGSGHEVVLVAMTGLADGDTEFGRLADDGDPEAGSRARRFIGAATEGEPALATIEAVDLETIFSRLEAAPIRLSRDQLSYVGLVLVLGGEPVLAAPARVVAAHWVRPLARDTHGHVQRLGPAVLATWEPRTGAWEHFAWGVLPELAMRIGRKAGDLELEAATRARRIGTPIAGA